ncbi:restriction endonuclease subunit S [Formosa haliotis]|uniref:restriction endonuclease subunit S n=1 Tax=Formosa haliotis TaxID=1555194 RepID=UPI000825884B|nr:restriction endonuclease subunit S [Formosa haliotis]
MKLNYKRLGDYLEPCNEKNDGNIIKTLQGISNRKYFQKAKTNTIGVDLSKYRVVRTGQFAFNRATTRNGDKISIALRRGKDCIVSPSYRIFKSKDENILNSEYLMMWFQRPDFDRYARYKSHGSAHEFFDWDEMQEVELPIPSIEKQREIVAEYNTIVNRIKLNETLNQKLEETAQALYKHWFVEKDIVLKSSNLASITSLITDGKHGNCKDEYNSGYYFLSAKDVRDFLVYENSREITKKDFDETHRRTNLQPYDICLVNTGATIGRMCLAPNNPKTYKSTFQKSVAVIKPKENVTTSFFLYCLLKNRMKEIIELGKGTSQSNLLLGDLKEFEVEYPDFFLIKEFDLKVNPIYKQIEINYYENLCLIKIKDLLLSKMSKAETKTAEA